MLIMGTLVWGCAGARLYSKTRDNQGVAAQAAWKHVNLTKMVSADRDSLNQEMPRWIARVRNFLCEAIS